jgi:hypothetical protein
MKAILNILGKVVKTTIIASGGTLIAILSGLLGKIVPSDHATAWEMILASIAAGAVSGLIAGLKRLIDYKPELDPSR